MKKRKNKSQKNIVTPNKLKRSFWVNVIISTLYTAWASSVVAVFPEGFGKHWKQINIFIGIVYSVIVILYNALYRRNNIEISQREYNELKNDNIIKTADIQFLNEVNYMTNQVCKEKAGTLEKSS